MSLIEWRRDKRRIILPIALLGPSDGSTVDFVEGRALLDTGATASGITPRMVKQLSLRGQGKRPLNSAHGEKQTERYIFRIGFFPDVRDDGRPRMPYIFDEILGFGLEDSFQLEALIGMDILSQCDFTMTRNERCTLSFGFA